MQKNKESDEALVLKTREGSTEEKRAAMEELLTRYKEFARQRTHSYFLIGADRDDVIQEGMIGLYKAILSFDPEKESSFRTFADICIRRQILTAVKNASRMKHYPLNSSISLNSTITEEGEEQEVSFMDMLAASSIVNPENIYISKEEKQRIETEISAKLSPLEWEVLALTMDGLDYQKIAVILDRPPKSIDNADRKSVV